MQIIIPCGQTLANPLTQAFLNESVDACTEGLIVKTLHDTYEPSRRSSHWLKLKKVVGVVGVVGGGD
jgi:ATP-dependent DNA ligase